MLVSTWDGLTTLLASDNKLVAKWELNAPARLAWSGDGSFAIAGSANGQLTRLERDGKSGWKQSIPTADAPPVTTPPAEVVTGIPVHQGGRVPGGGTSPL